MINVRLHAACELAAKIMGVSVEEARRLIYEDVQREYDREDVVAWLNVQEYKYTEQDVDKLYTAYRDNYDAEFGTWDNISNAYHALNMNLPNAADDESELECDTCFPLCQKCKYADECEAYQHAREVHAALSTTHDPLESAMFQHNTDNCESFEPAEIPSANCSKTCTCHKCNAVIPIDCADIERGSVLCPCCGELLDLKAGDING